MKSPSKHTELEETPLISFDFFPNILTYVRIVIGSTCADTQLE
jgi:hypothetical protein